MAGAELELMGEKRGAKQEHSLAVACLSWEILDTVLAEGRDGNASSVPRTPYAQSHCVRVCALVVLKGDQPDNVRCHPVAEQNLTQQILS